MTTYAVFDRDAKDMPMVLADRFSWFAAILPPVYAIVHGLWLELVGFVIVVMLLGAARMVMGGGAVGWIYVLFAVWIGFEAPGFRRAALLRRGWRYRIDVVARGRDIAELEGLKARP